MEYARGVDRLLWDLEKRPMPDAEAVKAVITANASEDSVDALDIGAALVLLHAMRLELDCMEADVLDAARATGLGDESLAAVMDLPDAAAVCVWERWLNTRRKLPAVAVSVPRQGIPEASRDAAARAGQRASQAADRAAAVARRGEQLRQNARPDSTTRRAEAERAAAYASEARLQANDAAERVALGLLRAANALDRCAARCQEWNNNAEGNTQLRERAEEYSSAAQRYRQMAARYRDIGRQILAPGRNWPLRLLVAPDHLGPLWIWVRPESGHYARK
jgi:hypothetical protein